ncbi:mitochondrial ribonuclease P catalytic subunit [Vanessa cardui]|uniref:mitochondrial ribonuclease P catalytic subunit n=1 Tax=Vanessa cardui TaxID=171605 RepID=UPI001F148DDA|nr:mitochondrial ribonuclease P catalytic subunit [Vanessa cardui]
MSIIYKNLMLFRKGFQLKKSYVNFASRFTNQPLFNHNEQMEILKKISGNTNCDWTELKNNVLCKQGVLNQKNIDAVILKVLVTNKKFDIALSFANYLKSSKKELSLGAMNGLLNLYYEYAKNNELSNEAKKFILDAYNSLYDKYKVLDTSTCEKLLHALCSINEWKKCMKVLDDINLTGTPSHSAYSFLVATLFKNNKRTEALKLSEKCTQDNRPLQDIAFDEWIKYIFRKYKDKEILLKYLNELCLYISNNTAVVSVVTAQKLKESFEYINWEGNMTEINQHSGKCKTCNETLDCLKLSEEEFSMLQKNVKDKLIVGSDLFLKTSPDELKRFLNFVEKTAPYDVVLDALNIAYTVGKSDISERIRVIGTVIDYFAQKKMRILLLGRRHMLKWRKFNFIIRNTESFFIDNISQDDPYFITAAILSGAHTDIVSRDLLRGHRFLMKQDQLKQLFQRWQWQHQWMVFVPSYKPVIQAPLKFTPIAQKNKNGWHLPYISDKTTNFGQVNNGIPDCSSWLCLRQKSIN